MCDWEAKEGWIRVLDRRVKRFEKSGEVGIVSWCLFLCLCFFLFPVKTCHINCYICLSGGFVASLPVKASDVPSSLLSPVINTHAYEWKCLRFWYFIGSSHGYDWHTASLMVLLRKIMSNQTMLLFFVDELTNEAQYTQIPLPDNYTNAQVLTKLEYGAVLLLSTKSVLFNMFGVTLFSGSLPV